MSAQRGGPGCLAIVVLALIVAAIHEIAEAVTSDAVRFAGQTLVVVVVLGLIYGVTRWIRRGIRRHRDAP